MVKSPDRLGGMGMRNVLTYTTQCPSVGSDLLSLIIVGCKPATYLSSCYDRCLLESTWTWVKGMMTMIGCAVVVSVSASYGRSDNLT